jgi:glyoxylase-like metal-dependent hydrolase (beta-lactamase superfamily II)
MSGSKPASPAVVDRRSFMALAGAAALSPALGGPLLAGIAPLNPQAPGFYRRTLGAFTITMVNDGAASRPVDASLVPNASLDEVKAALLDAFLPIDTFTVPFTAAVVDTGANKILIDGGNGTFGPPGTGKLLANMKAAGIDPASIDTVLVSHFHPDHINGLRDEAGALVFENAFISVPEAEWKFWMDDERMAAAPEGFKGLFQMVRRVFEPDAKMIKKFKDGQEIVAGVQAVLAAGHTPGHSAFALASGSESLLLLTDTANHPALFVRNPDWQFAFDMDKEAARLTRRKLLDRAAADRMMIGGYHFPFPAQGHVARAGNGFEYIPAEWQPTP